MSLQFIFFDRDLNKIQKYTNVLRNIPGTNFIHDDLENLLNKNSLINCIVSPANSYGFMNGGIDRDINTIMDNIEVDVKQRIEEVGNYDRSGRKFLPIGKCEVIQKNNKILFVAPTMVMPGYLINENEKNIFHAFYAILQKANNIVKQHNINLVIACPCLGTGVGNMDPTKSAIQVKQAIETYYSKKK